MQTCFSTPFDLVSSAASFFGNYLEAAQKIARAAIAQNNAIQDYWAGVFKYSSSFMAPSIRALSTFINTEKTRLLEHSPMENMIDYTQLLNVNIGLAQTGFTAGMNAMHRFFHEKLSQNNAAWKTAFADGKEICDFSCRLEQALKVSVHEYPKAIEEIKPEYGFHFEEPGYVKVAETDRFDLYQVLPTSEATSKHKPVLIIPPYVLGANILAFLPGEQRSYVHCYANQGIPTYIRVIKDIDVNPAVQVMTGEDDAADIRYFCRRLVERHGRKVTLNGFCQGGYHSLAAILTGELDGLVDALITCATPVDGSRSKSLKEYMMSLPKRFREIGFSLKILPNGNQVVDGRILGWVYKLRKMETESPIAAFHRDLSLFDGRHSRARINKTAAAVNHWLTYDQKDLPVNITKMSLESYTTPIDEQGNLPVTLFGRKLNFRHLKEANIQWLICIAESDDLVDREASLIPLDFIDAEVCVFPKGHAALATSWSIPTSQCALHLRFTTPGSSPGEPVKVSRGPVCFQLDLEEEPQSESACISDGEAATIDQGAGGGDTADKISLPVDDVSADVVNGPRKSAKGATRGSPAGARTITMAEMATEQKANKSGKKRPAKENSPPSARLN